jgi:hypothetical protein
MVGPNRPKVGNAPARQSTEIKKLLDNYADPSGKPKKAIEWVRIHKLPEYVHFPHMRHVNAGVACQSCHGQVQQMARVLPGFVAQHGLVCQLPRERLQAG